MAAFPGRHASSRLVPEWLRFCRDLPSENIRSDIMRMMKTSTAADHALWPAAAFGAGL
jgi:hypothetical protein